MSDHALLDLEWDALILYMFHHFLKSIRTGRSENILTSMDTIMTLVMVKSDVISSELLSALLDTLEKDNKDVLPIAAKLAEKVMGTCSSKLKPYMVELIQSMPEPKLDLELAMPEQKSNQELGLEVHLEGKLESVP